MNVMTTIDSIHCRTCLSVQEEVRNIHSYIMMSGSEVKLAEVLDKFYKLKVDPDDGYSQYICIKCCVLITNTYSFDIVIKNTQERLCKDLDDNHIDYDTYNDSDMEYYETEVSKMKTGHDANEVNGKHVEGDCSHQELYCTECPSKFRSTDELYQHSIKHHAVSGSHEHKCMYCIQSFPDYRSQTFHQKNHIYRYVCKNCWQGFDEEYYLKAHDCNEQQKKSKTRPEVVYRQCHHCGKSYPSGYIRIHMLTHSENASYVCPFCSKRFKVPCSLNSHILWNHKKSRNHKCEECGALFVTASARSAHYRKRHLNEKKHMCDTCGKKFFSGSQFKRHLVTHTGVKNFHCEMCDKSYQTKYGLSVHLKTHSQCIPSSL